MPECFDCEATFTENELEHIYPDIPSLTDRTKLGGTVPLGECPHCGSSVFPDDPK
jgi:hypothetical protein